MKKETERQKAVDLRKQGLTYNDISKELGASLGWVRKICIANNIEGHHATTVRHKEYKEYKAQGHTSREVAEYFGIAYKTAMTICRGIAPQTPRGNQNTKHTEEEKRDYVESMLPFGFSYDSGYIDCDHHVMLRCNVCDSVFDASMITIRQGGRIVCPNCAERDKAEKQRIEQETKDKRKAEAAQRKAEKEMEHLLKKRTVVCGECGKVFETYKSKQVCCSVECGRARANRRASHRKDSRIKPHKRIDRGITAKKLYDRDGGVCWICGGQCDLDDYITRESTIICGNNYPSVDHIVPVCEGGEDSWENVRLAHRRCNSLRFYNEISPPFADFLPLYGTPVRGPSEKSCPPTI